MAKQSTNMKGKTLLNFDLLVAASSGENLYNFWSLQIKLTYKTKSLTFQILNVKFS
jgi:hypothetical protein